MVNNESVVTTEAIVEPKKEETIEMKNKKIAKQVAINFYLCYRS